MKHPERVRRPPVERDHADRSFQTLFAPPREPSSAAAGGAAAPSLSDVVSQSVELGYRLIDDYIRQGEKAARRMSDRTATPQTMLGDAQEMAMRFAQHASGLAAVWIQLLQLTAASSGMPFAASFLDPLNAGAGGRPPRTPARDTHENGEPPAPTKERTRVRIEVVSSQPIETVLDLQPDAAQRPLVVHALRATDADSRRISDVTFQPGSDGAPACLRIRVPAAQPPGTYCGLIVDAGSSRPVGSLSVSLGDRPRDGVK